MTREEVDIIVEKTTTAVLEKLGVLPPTLRLAEAYRLYGRATVDRWIREKLVKKIKDGEKNGSVRLDRKALEKASLSSNRVSYFKSKESSNKKA